MFGEQHVAFTEEFLEVCPLLQPFKEYEVFHALKKRTSIIDIARPWDKLYKDENLSILKGMVTYGLKQVADKVSMGYSGDPKISRRVKDDLGKVFEEEAGLFVNMMVFPLFPVSDQGRKWLTESMSEMVKAYKPKVAKVESKEEEVAQLQVITLTPTYPPPVPASPSPECVWTRRLEQCLRLLVRSRRRGSSQGSSGARAPLPRTMPPPRRRHGRRGARRRSLQRACPRRRSRLTLRTRRGASGRIRGRIRGAGRSLATTMTKSRG